MLKLHEECNGYTRWPSPRTFAYTLAAEMRSSYTPAGPRRALAVALGALPMVGLVGVGFGRATDAKGVLPL